MKKLLFAAALAVTLCACGNTSKNDNILKKAEALLDNRPDSAQMILETLYPYSRLNDGQKARCGVLLAEARLGQDKSFASDSLLDNSMAYYENSGDTSSLLLSYRLAVHRAKWRGQQDSMSYYLERAVRFAVHGSKEQLYELYIDFAGMYSEPYAGKDYSKAIIYARKALECAATDEQKAYAFNHVGVCFSFMGMSDSASHYMEKAIGFSLKDSERRNYTGYALNYANIPGVDFKKAKEYLSAVPDTNSFGRLLTLGYLYLNNGQIDMAKRCCDRAAAVSVTRRYSINTYNSLRTLNACVKYAMSEEVSPGGNIVSMNDSVMQITSMNKARNEEMAEGNLLQQKYINDLKARNRLYAALAISGVFLCVIVFFLYELRSKNRYIRLRKELDGSRINQIRAYEESSGLGNGGGNAGIVEFWRQRVGMCKENFARTGWMRKLQSLEAQGLSAKSTFLPPLERERLRNALFEEFTDFVIDVKSAGEGVNLDDISLCLFNVLKVNNATISMCMGVSENAIRTRKSRLKEKLNPDMYQFVFGK